jgi:hypothetical protein
MSAKGLLPPAFAPVLSLTPPTLFPAGESVVDGHCKVTVRSRFHVNIRDEFGFEFESANAFLSRWNYAWD